MAQSILNQIHRFEGLPPATVDFNAAYQADTLLQKVPFSWDFISDAFLDIRRAIAAGQAPASGLKADTAKALFDAIHFKIS